ncbi:WXG100 family type VII secretion target [Paenibacillus alginolyticus]|uniref:WXG100 family type VII secretion target n=1 Tax=Paenibacillus alginolyticus TaxID=59839 RepID=A0ABT4G7C3_9BACL|nr:WXG100 family type VII secretion target [Paenibacillus alginolyticus]MCY9692049.1 WXG100 family type VII secretion target [Paenibacillus alginolyticus]MEC0144239.1 WXG100 family type VII secretion target [Paenibacillus alginolyticus]
MTRDRIKVFMDQLELTANKMASQTVEYKNEYTLLYKAVNDMGTSWQGIDNMVYVNQINGFKDDFENMVKLLNNYAELLRICAAEYTKAQEVIVNEAIKLTK